MRTYDPYGTTKRMIDRFDPSPAEPSPEALRIADAMMAGARQRLIDSDDPGVIALRAERMGLTYACPENPIYFDPRTDEDDWSQAMLNRDRSGELTGKWWFPLLFVGCIVALWLVLRGLGVK